jgi:site-specific DNA recombinase
MEVIRLLTNPVCIGMVRFKEELFVGQHQAIVPQELFDDVQHLLERNRARRGNSRTDSAHVFLLQGLLRCGRCGSSMTPKTSIGRGGKAHFYYQCTKNAHTSGTACDAKYVPAEAAEEYVLAELRKWSLSEEEIARVVREANSQKESNLDKLVEEESRLRLRLKEVEGRLAVLVDALEGGTAFRSLAERLQELETDRTSVEQELTSVRGETEFIRQNALSMELTAATYRDFPAMLDRLTEAEEWRGIKDLIARYVEVLDWHQDTEDPTTGSVDIMLFEEALAGREAGAEKTLDGPSVNRRCVERIERLPD